MQCSAIQRLDSEFPPPLERRDRQRFQPIDGAFALMGLRKMVVGRILNISESGFSFRYVASRQKVKGPRFVDIMMRGGSFHCYKIPCKTVWDRADMDEFSLGALALRSCGIQFGEMTDGQKSCLKYFIEKYASPSLAE